MNQNNSELYHFGVKGMKWGRRKVRDHAGPGLYLTRKRQLAGDKRDLEALNKGKHLSVGITKKRQDAYDKRDREIIEKRIAKNENYYKNKQAKKEEKAKKAQTEYNNMVKDNDKRVKMYGKKAVKVGGAINIAATAYGMHVGNKVIKSIGKSSVKSIAENPKYGNVALHTASILTVAGMGALTVSSLKKMNAVRKDMKLADEYELRQYMKKQNKK